MAFLTQLPFQFVFFTYIQPLNSSTNRLQYQNYCCQIISINARMWLIAWWTCGFESHQGHGCLSTVSQTGLWNMQVTHAEESYLMWCVQWVVNVKPWKGCQDPELGQNATEGEKIKFFRITSVTISTIISIHFLFVKYRKTSKRKLVAVSLSPSYWYLGVWGGGAWRQLSNLSSPTQVTYLFLTTLI